MRLGCGLLGLAFAGLTAGVAAAQPAPDCSRANTVAEKAICADPDLAAADAAMAQAYASMREVLPPDQQPALVADQRQWVGLRDDICGVVEGREHNRCLRSVTDKRRRLLAGEGPEGAADAPRLLPAFFRDARKGRYEISVAYPRLGGNVAPAVAAAFDQAVRDIVLRAKVVAEYRGLPPPRNPTSLNSYNVTYDITYIDPRLASVTFAISTYSGGAHPNSEHTNLVFDLVAGRRFSLADIVAVPPQAIEVISTMCRNQLAEKAAKGRWELLSDADFPAVVGEIGNWAPDNDGVSILFNPYSVAAYVVGLQDCRLSYAELAPLLKPGGPLPPRQS
jgi:uncharacterized protein YecT (DUF1311 family)